jgi:subtilisin-like proprotein convertase family protein
LKTFYKFAIAAVIATATPVAYATAFTYNGAAASDVDTNPATNVTLTVPDSGVISDLTLFVNLGQPYADDVSIFLSHDGTLVEIYLGMGDTNSSVIDATFDDAAGSSYPANGSAVGTFLPYQSLSAFDGLDINGDWRLQLLDNVVPGDGTPLVAWSISGDADSAVPEPSSMGFVAAGLATLIVGVRRVPKHSKRPGPGNPRAISSRVI